MGQSQMKLFQHFTLLAGVTTSDTEPMLSYKNRVKRNDWEQPLEVRPYLNIVVLTTRMEIVAHRGLFRSQNFVLNVSKPVMKIVVLGIK